MVKACIFDLDGVIVDTAKYHFIAWRRLANSLGFDFSEEENEKLKKLILSAASGGTINLKDLGVGDLQEIMETVNENEKAMENLEKPWE